MRKATTSIVYTSTWTKGTKLCYVHSERKDGDRTARFWFTGWNPFPCMYMVSTAKIVTKWLVDNGWTREIRARISRTNDVIDDCTGEVLDHSVSIYNYIPVRETAPEEELELIEILEDDEEYFD